MAGVINPGVEIFVNGTWTDISSDVQFNDGIDITRGRSNEGQQSDATTMTLTLDNRTGNYSPRNPRGIYYGQLGRNTQIRSFVRTGQVRARHAGGDYFSCASSAGLQISGDMDLRADVWLSTWRPDVSGYIGIFKNNSYGLYITPTGGLNIGWWSGTVFDAVGSSVPIPGGTVGRKAVRVSLDVNDGAGNHVATFYYSNDQTMSGTWVQFDQVTVAGTITIDTNTNVLQTSMYGGLSPSEVNEIRVYSGLGTTLRANPVFTSQASGTTVFADAQGNTWSNGAGQAQLDNRHYRFWGNVAEWPVKWDTSGSWRYAPITAAGVTRRIGQGDAPVKSALRRAIPQTGGAALVGYWPLEDAKGTTNPETVVGGTIRPKYVGNVEPSAYGDFVASAGAPTLNSGRIWLPCKPYANTNYFQVRFLLRIASTTIPNNTVLCRIWTNSTMGWIDWIWSTGDQMFFKTYNNLGVLSMTGSTLDITNEITGQDCIVSLEFKKNGTGVDCKQVIYPVGENSGFLMTDTNASITLGSITNIYINPDGANLGDVSIGHVRAENVETSVFDLSLQTNGFRGEAAIARIKRLCDENGITSYIAGQGEASEVMGYQTRTGLLSLLQEAASVDGGILNDTRMSAGLRYRSRESLCTQDPAVTISYAAEGLANFDPVDDDQRTRNKITVTRIGGTSVTVEDSTSSMGTADPPTGVGVYDEAVQLSLYSDDMAQHQAGWRVNLGTIDEARFPTIGVNLGHPDYTSNAVLTRQLLLANVGDRIVITNPPAWLPPEQIDQIVQGQKESITQFEHVITFNCAPARPYRVAQQNAPAGWTARYTNAATVLNGGMSTSATSVSITFATGPDWTIADGSFDIMVAGERMTVTNVTGSGGTQTITVTRSVNGIVKTHSAGEAVRLFDQVVYGLNGRAGSSGMYLRALDVNLPDPIYEYGNGINSITATSYAPLPTTPLNATIANPHPDRQLLVMVAYGGWGFISAGGSGFRVSTYSNRAGSTFTGTGPVSNGPQYWGEIIFVGNSAVTQFQVCYTTILDPSTFPYYFATQAYRDSASGTQTWEYATLRLVPLRYV